MPIVMEAKRQSRGLSAQPAAEVRRKSVAGEPLTTPAPEGREALPAIVNAHSVPGVLQPPRGIGAANEKVVFSDAERSPAAAPGEKRSSRFTNFLRGGEKKKTAPAEPVQQAPPSLLQLIDQTIKWQDAAEKFSLPFEGQERATFTLSLLEKMQKKLPEKEKLTPQQLTQGASGLTDTQKHAFIDVLLDEGVPFERSVPFPDGPWEVETFP